MLIRKAEKGELQAVLALQKLAYQSEAELYNDYAIPPLTQSLAQVEEEFDLGCVLVCMHGDTLLGSVRARLEGGICHIGKLIVSPEHQGRGIGTALMHEIEREYSQAQEYEVFTGMRSEANLRLYRRLGYREVAEKVINPELSLIFLRKNKQ